MRHSLCQSSPTVDACPALLHRNKAGYPLIYVFRPRNSAVKLTIERAVYLPNRSTHRTALFWIPAFLQVPYPALEIQNPGSGHLAWKGLPCAHVLGQLFAQSVQLVVIPAIILFERFDLLLVDYFHGWARARWSSRSRSALLQFL